MNPRFLALVALLALLSPLACDSEGRQPLGDTTVHDTTQPPTDVVADTEEPEDIPLVPPDLPGPQDSSPADLEEPHDASPADLVPTDVPVVYAECPEAAPGAGVQCKGDLSCSYGQECCCGECHAELQCECIENYFGCYYTDACLGGGWCNIPPCCTPDGGDHCAQVGDNYYCAVPDGAEYGKCMEPLKHPACWTTLDCGPGEICHEPAVCPCNADCDMEDTPGTCYPTEIPSGCCITDADCDQGTDAVWVCSWNEMSGLWGRCMGLLGDGSCWDDGDCPDGLECTGAFYCPCDAPCGAPDVPGTCTDPDEYGDVGDPCGPDGGPCKEGLACCYPCGIPGCQFECTEPCDESEPWCEGGCPMYA